MHRRAKGKAGTAVAFGVHQGGHDNALLCAGLLARWARRRCAGSLRHRRGGLADLVDPLPRRHHPSRRLSGLWTGSSSALMEIGYKLSCEEQGPNELIRFAAM